MSEILLTIHIVFVCVWLGANATLAFAATSNATAEKAARAWWAATQGAMAKVLYSIAGIGILVTGLLMLFAVDSAYEISDPFISIGFLAIIIGIGLGFAVFGPGSRELVSAIADGDDAKEKEVNNKLTLFGVIDTFVVVFTIYAMVSHLGA